MDILKLNSISPLAGEVLKGYTLVSESESPVGILVRSFNMADYAVPSTLLAVARAGAGVNNIPHADYAKKGICVFNTPGANANAVKELVLCDMLLAARNVSEGIHWAESLTGDDVAKQVEKGKSAFAGTEIQGKTLAILGLGAIGRKVAISANALGMNVVGYDPFLSAEAAAEIPFVTRVDSVASAYADADFISLHMPLTDTTKYMIDSDAMAQMKNGVIIINAARGELVCNVALKEGLSSGKIRKYVTDFPNAEVLGVKGVVAVPHLGASTAEAEDNCAVMAAQQMKDYLEKGNIRNSVNLPNLSAECAKAHRLTILSLEGTTLPYQGVSATRNGITYTIVDTDAPIDAASVQGEGILRVRNVF